MFGSLLPLVGATGSATFDLTDVGVTESPLGGGVLVWATPGAAVGADFVVGPNVNGLGAAAAVGADTVPLRGSTFFPTSPP